MAVTTLPKREPSYTEAEWKARVDLAAAHRISVMHGFQEGIFNHLTLTVPGKGDRYLQIPFGLHWSEATASSFMEIGFDGTRLAGEGEMELSCYCIHAPIHRLNPDAACVMHTHMPYASALARLEDPRILPIGQTEIGVMMQTGYDMVYTGPAFDPKEGERLAGVLGDKTILVMANHGVLTVGRTVAEAYDRLYYVERAAQVQLYAMWTGKPLHVLPDEVVEETIELYKGGRATATGRPPSTTSTPSSASSSARARSTTRTEQCCGWSGAAGAKRHGSTRGCATGAGKWARSSLPSNWRIRETETILSGDTDRSPKSAVRPSKRSRIPGP